MHGALGLCAAGLMACGKTDDVSVTVPPGQGNGFITPTATDPTDPLEPVACDSDPVTPVAVRRAFPLTVPATAGYKLEDAFPGARILLPMAVAWPASGGPLVLGRKGTIWQIEDGMARVLVDFQDEVEQDGEAGALGMTLHPGFGDGSGPSPYVYVWYNAKGLMQRLTRFKWNPSTRVLGEETRILEQAEQTLEHNAGRILFGADGFLYFGNGNDKKTENEQTLSRALFGGIFRIDVDKRGGSVSHAPVRTPLGATVTDYFIPNNNPFVGVAGALEEFYALGLRNPYTIAFDTRTGDLYAADVGETFREEIDRIIPGGNYEWPYKEGELVRMQREVTIGTAQPPLYAYSHAQIADLSAVIGGFVYRGKALPELDGQFVYSEYPTGRTWGVKIGGRPATRVSLFENSRYNDTEGFAQDPDGELYVLGIRTIARIVRDTASRDSVPQTLSETEIFTDTAAFAMAPGFVPYAVNSPLWSDGAFKRRFIRVPAGQRVTMDAGGRFILPIGTMFVKQFDVPAGKRRETRVIVVADDGVYGLGYRWNCAGTDARLVTDVVNESEWHYPSFGQCWACHRAENRVLGFTPQQTAAQFDMLKASGVLDPAVGAPPPLTSPADTHAPIEARALAYLAANCAGCHHTGAKYLGGEQTWIATAGVALDRRGLIGAPHHNVPVARGLGILNAPLIDPGHPENSLLLARMKSTNHNLQMPPIARTQVDELGVQVVEDWIRSLQP